MTRINLIPVEELTDQHLMAEYRELPMIAKALEKTLKSKLGYQGNKVSPTYVLGTGHIYFFYNKRNYLVDRYIVLVKELNCRKFSIEPNARNMYWEVFDNITQVQWQPSAEEIEINRNRINERISLKPDWYRKTKYE